MWLFLNVKCEFRWWHRVRIFQPDKISYNYDLSSCFCIRRRKKNRHVHRTSPHQTRYTGAWRATKCQTRYWPCFSPELVLCVRGAFHFILSIENYSNLTFKTFSGSKTLLCAHNLLTGSSLCAGPEMWSEESNKKKEESPSDDKITRTEPKMPFHKCNRNYDGKIIRMRIKSRRKFFQIHFHQSASVCLSLLLPFFIFFFACSFCPFHFLCTVYKCCWFVVWRLLFRCFALWIQVPN